MYDYISNNTSDQFNFTFIAAVYNRCYRVDLNCNLHNITKSYACLPLERECVRVCACSPVLLTYVLPPAIPNCSPQWLVLSSKVTGSVFSLCLPPCLLSHFLSVTLSPFFRVRPFFFFTSLVFLSVLLSACLLCFSATSCLPVLSKLSRCLSYLLVFDEQAVLLIVLSPLPPPPPPHRWPSQHISSHSADVL